MAMIQIYSYRLVQKMYGRYLDQYEAPSVTIHENYGQSFDLRMLMRDRRLNLLGTTQMYQVVALAAKWTVKFSLRNLIETGLH